MSVFTVTDNLSAPDRNLVSFRPETLEFTRLNCVQ